MIVLFGQRSLFGIGSVGCKVKFRASIQAAPERLTKALSGDMAYSTAFKIGLSRLNSLVLL